MKNITSSIKNVAFLFFVVALTLGLTRNSFAITSPEDVAQITQEFATTIKKLSDRKTGIAPSHYGHPGYESLSFLYDITVNAMILKVAGQQKDAEKVMDYFSSRLNIPVEEVVQKQDSNKIYGILKVFKPKTKTVGFVNSINLNSDHDQGRGELEFLTTPGPVSFMIMAFLQVNSAKYLSVAEKLGETMLAMQREDGAIFDGDRFSQKVHTEPHVDAANAFYQLYEVTSDVKWKQAGDRAADWFKKNVFIVKRNQIYQGIWENGPNDIFATDVYSWTMAGRFGDFFTIDELEGITNTMLKKCLSRVALELPGGETQSIVMSDFADSNDMRIKNQRNGFHPMGSPEWSGGVILALQKNAVRFWDNGYQGKARFYKAMAELLEKEVLKSSYYVKKMLMFPYATGQGIEVGHGWKTPYFYVKSEKDPVLGGSLVGGWPIFPMNGFNPFILNDTYKVTYNAIDLSEMYEEKAQKHIDSIVSKYTYQEDITTVLKIDKRDQIVEPGQFNKIAWKAFNQREYKEAILWAGRVIDDPKWVELARREEKLKAKDVGGIIDYPWGKTYKNNAHPLHIEIWKYPLLNEVGAAMWLLASSYYELGDMEKTKFWLKRILTEVPHHQIADVVINPETGKRDLIDGYWNAVISWVYNPSQSARDNQMGKLIKELDIKVKAPDSIVVQVAYLPKETTKTTAN